MDAVIQTKKIMRKAIMQYSKELKREPRDTQIKIFTDSEESTPRYEVLRGFKEKQMELTLKQLMLVPKVDFTGKGMKAELFVEPAIKNILKRLSNEEEKDISELSVIVAVNDNDCEDLRLILAYEDKPLRLISLEKIME